MYKPVIFAGRAGGSYSPYVTSYMDKVPLAVPVTSSKGLPVELCSAGMNLIMVSRKCDEKYK